MKTEISNKKILVILPCYNEEKSIGELILALKKIKLDGVEICPLAINDCSTDNTLAEIQKHNIAYLDLKVNLGIGGAVQSGLIYAKQHDFDIAIQMDGDGQHPPSELIKVIEPIINDKADVSIGSRFIDKEGFQSSAARRAGIKFLSALIKLFSGIRIFDCTSGYRAFNKKAIDLCVTYYPEKYPEPESILYLIKNGAKVVEVPVIMAERSGGKSSIGNFNSIYYMLKVSFGLLVLSFKKRSGN